MGEDIRNLRALLTPAEQMLRIRDIVIGYEDQQEAINKLAEYLQSTDQIQEHLRDLESRAWIRETEFQSQVPVIGRMIVAIRNFWNWMSTKWYILPILQQQNSFNAAVVQMIRDLWNCNNMLLAAVSSLQSRIEKLENLLTNQDTTNYG